MTADLSIFPLHGRSEFQSPHVQFLPTTRLITKSARYTKLRHRYLSSSQRSSVMVRRLRRMIII